MVDAYTSLLSLNNVMSGHARQRLIFLFLSGGTLSLPNPPDTPLHKSPHSPNSPPSPTCPTFSKHPFNASKVKVKRQNNHLHKSPHSGIPDLPDAFSNICSFIHQGFKGTACPLPCGQMIQLSFSCEIHYAKGSQTPAESFSSPKKIANGHINERRELILTTEKYCKAYIMMKELINEVVKDTTQSMTNQCVANSVADLINAEARVKLVDAAQREQTTQKYEMQRLEAESDVEREHAIKDSVLSRKQQVEQLTLDLVLVEQRQKVDLANVEAETRVKHKQTQQETLLLQHKAEAAEQQFYQKEKVLNTAEREEKSKHERVIEQIRREHEQSMALREALFNKAYEHDHALLQIDSAIEETLLEKDVLEANMEVAILKAKSTYMFTINHKTKAIKRLVAKRQFLLDQRRE